jgi:hypothetical protein
LRQVRIWGLAADVALHDVGWAVTVLKRAAELAEAGPGSACDRMLNTLQWIDPGLVRVLHGRLALQGVAGLRSAGGLLAGAAGRLAD